MRLMGMHNLFCFYRSPIKCVLPLIIRSRQQIGQVTVDQCVMEQVKYHKDRLISHVTVE